jgi:hypothetical protein
MAEELQRIVAPYGDIVLASTPTLDRVSNQLYQEQQQRLALKMKENQALDAGIQKELGKVRSVDTPEIIQSYNNYKQLKKQLLFDKNLQKDPIAYNQLQQAANQAYQDIFSKANKSAEVKEMAKTMTTDRFKNPDNYADDYGQRVSTLMATPISALQQHPEYGDLTNWDQYRYQGSNTDFSKLLNNAMGMPKQVYTSSKVLDGGLQTELTPYTFTNTPAQVYENLLGSFATHKAGRDAAYQWDNIPTEQVQATVEKYKQIPASKWQQMGLPSPQELGTFTDNKADNYAKYLAMNYAINNEPKQGTPVFRENKRAVMDAQEAKERRMLALRHSNAKELIQLRKDIDPSDTEMNNTWVESYMQQLADQAKKSGRFEYKYKDGRRVYEYDIPVDPVLGKALSEGNVTPDAIRIDEDGNFRRIFYKRYGKDEKEGKQEGDIKEVNGRIAVDDVISGKKLTPEQVALALGYRGQTKKQLEETMQSVLKGGQPKQESKKAKYPLPAGKPRTVKQGGFTYTWNEQTGEYE